MKEGTCLAPGPSFTAYAVVTIVSDVIVAVLPIPVLLKLNIRLEKKLGLIAIFLLGLFTTICSVLRYVQIDRIQFGDGNSTMLVLWGTIEFNVGVSNKLRGETYHHEHMLTFFSSEEHGLISAIPSTCLYEKGQGVPQQELQSWLRRVISGQQQEPWRQGRALQAQRCEQRQECFQLARPQYWQ